MKFADEVGPADYKAGTVAWLIERYIAEMASVYEKPVGPSQSYGLRAIARTFIGAKQGNALTKKDIKDYANMRRQQFVKNTKRHVSPTTIGQEISFLRGVLKYAEAEWDDCPGIKVKPIRKAEVSLRKHNLISKSQPRSRRPTAEEIALLLTLAAERNKHARTEIDFVLITRWQIASGRRISETCRLMWGDWNKEDHTMLVRKMKDPRTRNKDKEVALTDDAQAMLLELEQMRTGTDPTERIFPYNCKSCSQGYADLKHKAGITGLRLHDSRRECGSRLVEEGRSSHEAILVTGHETPNVFEKSYLKLNPKNFKNGPISKRNEQPSR